MPPLRHIPFEPCACSHSPALARRLLPIILILLGLSAALPAGSAEIASGCLPTSSVPVTVRIGDAPASHALLEGGIETPLSLFDAETGHLLWSAAAHAAAIQTFPHMDAAFTGSFAAIDLDADGTHDRIYAGDMAGRIWRFDLQHGASAEEWATGGIFADFSNAEGRGFLAAPDVSLSAPPGGAPWLNIAIGTAAPGNPAASNRFYALRDHAVHASWSAQQYEEWQPLREEDLLQVRGTVQAVADAAAAAEPAHPGWYVELGSGHVVTPTLTINHRAVLVIAAAVPREGAPCEIFARIASFDLREQQIIPIDPDGAWRAPLPEATPAAANLTLILMEDGIAECTLADQRVPACDVDTRPRKTWWRRTDAE